MQQQTTPTRTPRRSRRAPYRTDAQGAIILKSADEFQSQIARARELRPLVVVVKFGSYKVTKREAGAKTYDVHLWFDPADRKRKGKCSCAAGTPPVVEGVSKYAPLACYHLIAAAGRHMQLAAERLAGSRGVVRQMPQRAPAFAGRRQAAARAA